MRESAVNARNRTIGVGLMIWVLLGVLIAAGLPDARGQVAGSHVSGPYPLTIERFEFNGNTRTSNSLALMASGLAVGEVATPMSIHAAAERLRESHLFREVAVHTRPGSRAGLVDVVFSVKENRPHLRFGVGHEDFSGWYLIPVQLNLDNLTGHGETVRLSTRIGYRLSGLVLSIQRPLLGSSKTTWELRLRGESQARIYFNEGTEIQHNVGHGGADLCIGHRFAESWIGEIWAGGETVTPDSSAKVYRANEDQDREQGDEIDFDQLPLSIQGDLVDRKQSRIGIGLFLDRRRGSGLHARGVRARVDGEGVFWKDGQFGLLRSDLRGYLPITERLQLAARVRLSGVSSDAPFDERFYLGGLYTARGFPSHSLSPPQGELNLATLSFEIRSAWIGPAEKPRLAGLLFFDLGLGGNQGFDPLRDGAAGIGYGIRWRLPWVGYFGLDVGHPLTPAPVDEQFHLNLSLGWSF